MRIHLLLETGIHSSLYPNQPYLRCFQSKSSTKAAKNRRGKSGSAAADKDLALKLEPVIPSSSSSPSSSSHLGGGGGSLLARPPAKNFTCGVCGMQFVRKDSWGSHVRQHERAGETAAADSVSSTVHSVSSCSTFSQNFSDKDINFSSVLTLFAESSQ